MMKKIWSMQAFRYLFWGGCTTGVNLATFALLEYAWDIPVSVANLISILTALIFAFFVNRWLVFQKDREDLWTITREFASFAELRFCTLGIEFFGVVFLHEKVGLSAFLSKLLIQIIIIILNYLISKFIIFGQNEIGGAADEPN